MRVDFAEAVPTGRFGGHREKTSGWTKAEQDRHYADLCDAIGAPNDRAPRRSRTSS